MRLRVNAIIINCAVLQSTENNSRIKNEGKSFSRFAKKCCEGCSLLLWNPYDGIFVPATKNLLSSIGKQGEEI